MIHDYYLSKAKEYKDVELAQRKRRIRIKLKKDKNISYFYPSPEDLQKLPGNFTLIKISFTLKKPYISKDEGEFYLLEWTERERGRNVLRKKIIKNPIVRDTLTGLPMVRPSAWKGHLRFAAEKVEWKNKDEKKKIVKRLFGSKTKDENPLKGRLYFFPTLFKEEAERDIITPLKRDIRTPTARGPIPLEVMKPGESGEFYLLYLPYPKDKDFNEEQIKEDLEFIAEALKLMFYTYGFSAKKTSGFGVIKENLTKGKIWINPNKQKEFKNLDELIQKLNNLWSERK